MKKDLAPDILDVFKRNGKLLYLYDLRVAIFPLPIILISGLISAGIIILLPGLIRIGIIIITDLFQAGRIEMKEISISLNYITNNWQLLLFFTLGSVVAWIRKFCVSKNLAVDKQVSPQTNFRIGYEEVISACLIAGVFFFISETAINLNIFTLFGSLVLYTIWKYFHDVLLEIYVYISNNTSPRYFFSIWSFLLKNDIVKLSSIKKIKYKSNQETIIFIGNISEKTARKMRKKIKEKFKNINQVIIESEEKNTFKLLKDKLKFFDKI